jgi:putative PIN family toxin of toxin-antitoxin system
MKKIIIDTNILVSAAIADGKPERLILLIIAHRNNFKFIVSREIMEEYIQVLNRPRLKLTEYRKQEWFNLLNDSTTVIDVNVTIDFPRDRKDAKFLACAVAANADYLITGDRDFEDIKKMGIMNTKIISVTEFLNLFSDLNN